MPDPTLLEIFVSYSHHDAGWRERLFGDNLSTTFGDCRVWTDAQIRAGDDWLPEIERRLANATVAVLLVSPSFLKSAFIQSREWPTILARARTSQLRIVWVPINIHRQALDSLPALAALQGASGFEARLPAAPGRCSAALLDRVRAHIRQQMRVAIDPVGASLAQLLATRYEVGRLIGAGNRAAVYQARDRVLQRQVAIKVPRAAEQRQAFMSDVHDAIRMSEEANFINIYDAASDEQTAYCVIQHIGGKTLKALISEHPRGLPVQTFRRIFRCVTTAIARAHALGVTYGNLKPSNILLDDDDEPYILPVGRRRDRARDAQKVAALVARLVPRTEPGAAAGAPASADLEDLAYLVPDHFGDEFEVIDPRLTDQYMLGVLAYQMATGELPATVPSPERLLQDGRAAFKPLPPITDRRRLCPQRFADLVARMASRLPAKRFPSLPAALAETDLLLDLDLLIARDSYRRCTAAPGFDTLFFQRFYSQFLQRCPAAGVHFERFASEQWVRQHRMLKEAVLLLFAFRQQSEHQTEPNVLSRIAASHRQIPLALYGPFLDALVHTVCGDEASGLAPFDPECADPANRDALEQYWRGALAPGMDYLKWRAVLD